MADSEEQGTGSSSAAAEDRYFQRLQIGPADPALLQGRQGRWRWPWAVIGTAVLGAGTFLSLKIADGADQLAAQPFGGLLDTMEFVAGRPDSFIAFLTYAFALAAPVVLALVAIHGLSWKTALGPNGTFNWTFFWRGAGAILTVYVFSTLLTYVREPENFTLQPKAPSYLFWLALGILVILPQAFAEEFVFKGYLARVWGAVVPSRLLIVGVLATVFTWLHAENEDIKVDLWFNLVSFVATEIVTFFIFLRTLSLGAMTGLHWMNNVVSLCILTSTPGSAFEFAIVKYTDPVLSAGGTHLTDPRAWAELVVGLAALWVLLTWRRSPFHLPALRST
jgi:hypothetical protein